MVANERPKQKNAESKLTKLVSKEKESDDNFRSAGSKDVVENSTQNIVFELDIEDKPNIDFYNTSKVPNNKAEPRSSDFNDIPELPIISNVVDCTTQTSNNKSLCSKLFMRKDYFESFYDEYLEFKYYVQSKLDGETQQTENKSDHKNQILKNKINHLELEIINLKKINKDLKSDSKSHLEIIETLSEGNPIDAPWQTTSSTRVNNSNRTIIPTRKVNNKNLNDISLHNPYEILYVDDTGEQEVDKFTDTTETKRQKVRSNRINRVSVRKEQTYYHQMNVPHKIAPRNQSNASATEYGKKAIVIGDSHLQRINGKLFNESLSNCRSSLKYFSGANTLDLEHYMKPSLNNNQPDAVVIHIGSNDIIF